jgi:AraC-like DNA-binding protein
MELTDMVARQEQARRWTKFALGPVEYLRARYVTHRFAPHAHEEFAIGAIDGGVEAFRYRGALRVAPPGTVILLDPDEMHTGHAAPGARGWEYRMLYPPVEVMRRAAGIEHETISFPNPVVDDPDLARRIRALHRAAEHGASDMGYETRLLDVVALAIQRHASFTAQRTRPTPQTAIRLAKEFLDANYQRNVSLTELAKVAQLSPFHLNHVFSRVIGLPPHRYLEQVRVRRARELLRGPTALACVAFDAGFRDQSHLTNHFKRHLGVTPGQYRRAVAARA